MLWGENAGRRREKGVGTRLCEAPFGPFRQTSPDPFSQPKNVLRQHSHAQLR